MRRVTARLTDGQRALAADPAHRAYAARLAARWARGRPHLADEFAAAATDGLVAAARLFDPGRGVRFTTFLTGRVNGSIRDRLRELVPKGCRRNGRPAPATFGFGDLPADDPFDPAEDLPGVGWEAESHDELDGLTRGLPGRYGEAVRLYYGTAGASVRSVARRMGLSEGGAFYLVTRGVVLRESPAAGRAGGGPT